MKTTLLKPSRLALALLAAGTIGGAGAAAMGAMTPAVAAPAPALSAPIAPSSPPNFAQITRDYGPTVVNISVSGTRKVSAMDDDDPFAQFFGQIPGARGRMPAREVPMRGEARASSSAATA